MENPTQGEPRGDASANLDGHGRAALLLVESLMHALVARGDLSVAEAVSTIEIALDAQLAIIEDVAQPTPSMREAAPLLSALLHSMKIDQTIADRED